MGYDFDAIVIGSGAGGAAFAQSLASAGKNTLIVERGHRPAPELAQLNEQSTLIDRKPYDDRQVCVNGEQRRLYMGGTLGGSTAVYGGVMLRPSANDFHPGKHYGEQLDRAIWDWPISYEQLEPYYDRAESLFKLSGRSDENYDPLKPPHRGVANNVLPLAPINERLMAKNRSKGLRPFQLPLTIDSSRCERCDACAGFLCPHSARRTAGQIVDEAVDAGSLHLKTGTEVERIETDREGNVSSIVVRDRDTGTLQELKARCYALAAGALASTAIMLRSGFQNANIGRHYMMHYSPIAVGVFPHSTGADETFVKQVGFADFYFGTPRMPQKMGLVQSLPAPGPLMMAKSGLKRIPKCFLKSLRKRMLPLAGIVEDLPRPENRIFLNRDGRIAMEYDFSAFDQARGKALSQAMKQILRRAGAVFTLTRSFPSREHVAHQCGTLRSGSHPDSAVVDADCRVFGSENLFVVDGSVLPTSLGVRPSLTIAANALRVADVAMAAV